MIFIASPKGILEMIPTRAKSFCCLRITGTEQVPKPETPTSYGWALFGTASAMLCF